jgi:hypothetical protein
VQASTIKMHLSRIFQKTGCSNQVDLMALMADLSLPIEADETRTLPIRADVH